MDWEWGHKKGRGWGGGNGLPLVEEKEDGEEKTGNLGVGQWGWKECEEGPQLVLVYTAVTKRLISIRIHDWPGLYNQHCL